MFEHRVPMTWWLGRVMGGGSGRIQPGPRRITPSYEPSLRRPALRSSCLVHTIEVVPISEEIEGWQRSC
jgi:hypothetical protein